MKKFFMSVFVGTCVEIKFYGAFARWRGNAAPDALVDFHTGRHRPLGVGHEHLRAADDEEDGRVPRVVDVVPPRITQSREVPCKVRADLRANQIQAPHAIDATLSDRWRGG